MLPFCRLGMWGIAFALLDLRLLSACLVGAELCSPLVSEVRHQPGALSV